MIHFHFLPMNFISLSGPGLSRLSSDPCGTICHIRILSSAPSSVLCVCRLLSLLSLWYSHLKLQLIGQLLDLYDFIWSLLKMNHSSPHLTYFIQSRTYLICILIEDYTFYTQIFTLLVYNLYRYTLSIPDRWLFNNTCVILTFSSSLQKHFLWSGTVGL